MLQYPGGLAFFRFYSSTAYQRGKGEEEKGLLMLPVILFILFTADISYEQYVRCEYVWPYLIMLTTSPEKHIFSELAGIYI